MPPTIRKTISRRKEGTEILRATLVRPPSVPAFVLDLIQDAENYVETVLAAEAEEAFAKDTSPDKRFYFPRFEYRLAVEIAPEDQETAALTIASSLSADREQRQGRKTCRFRIRDGTLLPPKKKKDALGWFS